MPDSRHGNPAKIVVEGLSKSFTRDKLTLPVVDNVTFSVANGEFVAIVGPSGCGKSTLMNIIAGFEKPDSGRVLIDGVEQKGPSKNGIVISQYGSVFPWLTVRENLMFGLGRADAALPAHYAAMAGRKAVEN